MRADHVRGGDHRQRVAVRLRLGDLGGADGGARAGLVLDDDRLPQRGRELFLEDARRDVGESAWAERDDDLDGAFRILRGGRTREGERGEGFAEVARAILEARADLSLRA